MQKHEHVNPTAARWIAEGWEPNCQDDYEWATDTGRYSGNAQSMPAFPKPGDIVHWHHEMRGGYGYVEIIPARVVSLSPRRVRIAVKTTSGVTGLRVVRYDSLEARDDGSIATFCPRCDERLNDPCDPNFCEACFQNYPM